MEVLGKRRSNLHPLVVDERQIQAFLHVPMPTALRHSFIPLPESLSTSFSKPKYEYKRFSSLEFRRPKEEEGTSKNRRNGRHQENIDIE